jgi:hypothetical protein
VEHIGRDSLRWRRSSHSGGGNDCVEIAFTGGATALRDSKDPFAGLLLVDAAAWRALLTVTRTGDPLPRLGRYDAG